MRVLAIGDIHGCLTALEQLLHEVRPQPDDLVITLGDYVDRGPDSKGVIDRLLTLSQNCQLMGLRGNHDLMMLQACGNPDAYREWLLIGGRETLASYGQLPGSGSLCDVPVAHWKFLEQTCMDWIETPTHLFVHANARPDLPMNQQSEYTLHWEKMIAPRPHSSGKVLICGHTAQRTGRPRNWGHTICIDTWVYGSGWLTCLDTQTGQIWQANQQGESRMFLLDPPCES